MSTSSKHALSERHHETSLNRATRCTISPCRLCIKLLVTKLRVAFAASASSTRSREVLYVDDGRSGADSVSVFEPYDRRP